MIEAIEANMVQVKAYLTLPFFFGGAISGSIPVAVAEAIVNI